MLTLTPSAGRRVREICGKPEYAAFARPGLRVRVVGGGCAGLSYDVEVVDGPRAGDLVVKEGDAEVFVDPKSAPLLDRVTLDFKRTMMASSFEWRNPAAAGTCGCGSSFGV
ncbi:MAG: iron-sulfur cluster assembly accessory protein [Planctomycetaceae bacterium]|nr:iron-sulfur cluster assembly accessory protein [Planctomycetota bacterium]NUN53722.1 iron-sulfur cluster assembly accessory protein [Planctomycetaceae bacterium]